MTNAIQLFVGSDELIHDLQDAYLVSPDYF